MKTGLTITIGLLLVSSVGACINSSLYENRIEQEFPPIGDMVDVKGAKVHVIKSGGVGDVVMLIHGASANAREFLHTLSPALDPDLAVLMPDRPGHGYSGRPARSDTLKVQADQMAGVLEQTLSGTQQAVVVGHSYGGAVALRLALDHPDLVKAVVLLAPVTHDWGGGGEAWYNTAAGVPVLGLAFSQFAPIAGPSMAESGIKGVFEPQPAPEDYIETSGLELLFRPGEFRANAKDVNALMDELGAQQERYPSLDIPVVVFSGLGDTVIKPELHVGKLHHQVKDIRVIEYTDVGHMPHHARPDEIAAVIEELAASPDKAETSSGD